MAHLHFKRTTYPSGGSAAAGRVAYITRQPVKALDRAEQQLRYIGVEGGNGQRREDLVYTQHRNLPAWAKDASTYFQAAERYEGKNRTAFEEWKISLPRELSHGQNLPLARDMLAASFGTTHPYTYAFHDPPAADGERQPHVHVLLSARTLDGIDRPPEQFFTRYNAKQPGRGGTRKDPAFTHMGAVFAQRQMLCDLTNVHLEYHGHAARLDPHSLADRSIDRAPEAQVYACLARQARWLTNADIAADTGLPLRTVRSKTRHLHTVGLVVRVDSIFPSYGYQVAELATEEQVAYRCQLEAAGAVYQQMAAKPATALSGQARGA